MRPFISCKPRVLVMSIYAITLVSLIISCNSNTAPVKENAATAKDTSVYVPPDTSQIPHDMFGDMVRYGRELIANTAYYIGPNGTVGHYLGNKMTCNTCHLDAGARPFAFNFFSGHARYPQYRGRENAVLDMGQRINNCIERPMNGLPLPLGSKEIVAMECYIKWLGTGIPTGGSVRGDENLELEIPDSACNIEKGEKIFVTECAVCHGSNGEGKWNPDSSGYLYPPLWGPEAFQNGSSPSRVLKLAGFIKANMPDKKATWRKPYLTDEQAINVAAFINDGRIHMRPQKKNKEIPDYPDPKTKAIDYEFGPYADTFSAFQHKFGPYKPIIEYHKAHNLLVAY